MLHPARPPTDGSGHDAEVLDHRYCYAADALAHPVGSTHSVESKNRKRGHAGINGLLIPNLVTYPVGHGSILPRYGVLPGHPAGCQPGRLCSVRASGNVTRQRRLTIRWADLRTWVAASACQAALVCQYGAGRTRYQRVSSRTQLVIGKYHLAVPGNHLDDQRFAVDCIVAILRSGSSSVAESLGRRGPCLRTSPTYRGCRPESNWVCVLLPHTEFRLAVSLSCCQIPFGRVRQPTRHWKRRQPIQHRPVYRVDDSSFQLHQHDPGDPAANTC